MKATSEVYHAFQVALTARMHSYSPYSKFKVGAALKLKGVDVAIGGCNIENASFGATICAERVALHRAIAGQGKIHPEFLIVVTGEEKATVPCALCLQSLAEFCPDNMPVYLGNEKLIQREMLFKDLLPHPFRQFVKDKP
jgi:homotetrameric cytidine deaminase